jgi:hypothetical protein
MAGRRPGLVQSFLKKIVFELLQNLLFRFGEPPHMAVRISVLGGCRRYLGRRSAIGGLGFGRHRGVGRRREGWQRRLGDDLQQSELAGSKSNPARGRYLH